MSDQPTAAPAVASPDEAVHAELRKRSLPTGQRLAYSVGATLDLGVNTALNVFLLFYATTACGLSAAMAGFALALGLVVDAVVDPLIGLISDNHHSRLGRRLPFMIGATAPLLLSFVLLFCMPDTDNQWLLFGLLALASTMTRLSLSLFNLPYLAAGAELSDDLQERSRIIALRWGIGMVAALITVAMGFGILNQAGGIAQRQGYPVFALAMAAMMLAAAIASMLAVRRTLDRQHTGLVLRRMTVASLLDEFRELLHSRSFCVLFLVALLFSAAQGVTQSLGLHANTFFWKLSTGQVQALTVATALGLVLGAPLAAPVLARVENRTAAMAGLAWLILSQALPSTLRLAGLLPLEGQILANTLGAIALLGGVATSIAAIAVLTMITNAVDEHELLFGVRRESSYFAGWAFAVKAAGGLGTLISGLMLHAIHFPTQQVKEQGLNLVLPQAMTDALGLYYGPGAALLSLLSLATMAAYRIDRGRHAEIMAQLNARLR